MKTILTIAGSDSSGGAGIQADIKSAHYHGVFATSAITAITAQNTLGVQGIVSLEPKFVQKQIKSIFDDIQIDAIKIGMLGCKDLILAIKQTLSDIKTIPIVLDPVAVSRAGSKLLEDDAIETLKELFDIATLITPNRYEAKLFFGVSSENEINNLNIKKNILFKNIENHQNKATDIFLDENNNITKFESPKANSNNTHGTGCSFSSSIASLLARGYDIHEAIKIAKKYIYEAIVHAPNLGKGNGPINHILSH